MLTRTLKYLPFEYLDPIYEHFLCKLGRNEEADKLRADFEKELATTTDGT